MNKYTSLKLSKLLAENGFKHASRKLHIINNRTKETKLVNFSLNFLDSISGKYIFISAYDILNDLCVKYAKEMFGEEWINISKKSGRYANGVELKAKHYYPEIILSLFQQNKKDEAENYLWEHCLFNLKNKL